MRFLLLSFFLIFNATITMAHAEDTSSEAAETALAETPYVVPAGFDAQAAALIDADFDQKLLIVQAMAAGQDKRALPLLSALVDGRLNSKSATPPQLVLLGEGDDPEASDALSGEALGKASALTLDSISVNNSLRGELRSMIARLQLASDDESIRLAAAKQLISAEPSAEMIPLLSERLKSEEDGDVKAALAAVLAMADTQSEDAAVRKAAIATLSGSLYPEVRARLQELADNDPVPEVKSAAVTALATVAEKIAFYGFLENLFFGLSLGSVLLLAAVGLAITFGVMGVINMAHGELIMLGAYTTYVMQQLMPNSIGASLLLSIPAAFLVSGLVGIAIERGVIRFLYGRPLETLLATFGISLVLQQAVRSIFSPLNREVASPSWMSGSLEINPVWSLTYNRLTILIFALIVFFLIMLVMKKTSLGLKLRAVAQNRSMARAVGVRASWVDALTFGLGSGIAGVAGVALSQLTNVGPNLGQGYIIDSFMVVVFGGVGNIWGTLVGAMGLGIFNKFLEPHAGAVLAKILVLVVIILFIQKRPRGLFPQKGRAAEA
ncbi:MAG: urea ABC transporter permease subunit UrtB [Pedobacter sp.]|nr:urea ABC transporter permease subunit UrtB [Pedobacter sp.]